MVRGQSCWNERVKFMDRHLADTLVIALCPIVIHISNTDAALGMQLVLKDAGWKIRRVIPMEDTNGYSTSGFQSFAEPSLDRSGQRSSPEIQ